VLASLSHPNIVKFYDCFMDDSYINIGVHATYSVAKLAVLVHSYLQNSRMAACRKAAHCCCVGGNS
jgi:serine/threonine protein kinase